MPFHLPGQLYSGCCLFPTPHPWQLPAQARAGTVMLWPQWEGGKGEPGTVVLGEGCTATDRPHSPPPFGCKYLKPLEGLAQVVSSCSLQTPWACQSKPWSLPFPHCLPLKPSISATPECLHCPDRLLETGVCSGARSSVPWNPSNNLIASGLQQTPSYAGYVSRKAHTGSGRHNTPCSSVRCFLSLCVYQALRLYRALHPERI